MLTTVCYLVAAATIYFAVPGMLQMACGGILSIVTFGALGIRLTMFLGASLAWGLLCGLWRFVEGGQMPIVVLAGGFVYLFVHGALAKDELTEQSEQMMAAEAWGIVAVAAMLMYYTDPIRWL